MSRKPQRSHTGLKVFLIALIIAMIAATGFVIYLCITMVDTAPSGPAATPAITLPRDDAPIPTETETQPPETTLPEPEHVVSTASIGAMGDLLMHMPIFSKQYTAECDNGDGTFDFSTVFQYIKEPLTSLDYAAANLETTLCGLSNGYAYSGFPHFNCPDEIVDGAKDAGFDMLLTANNHSYDTTLVGYKRTLEVVREKGLATLGTMLTPEEPKFTVEEVNGIQIGMICYTYADDRGGKPSLNGNAPISEAGLCNYFDYDNLSGFYSELEGHLADMKAQGAEATVLYIHWGVEYQTYANDTQKAMAQKLCDLGIDVIIGGHPHVVQPIDLLTNSSDPDKKTVIIYSLGNAVSNQRTGVSALFPVGYTEDGVLFSVTFEKYSDGTVYLAEANALPTWVNKFQNDNKKNEYNILPLNDSSRDQWKDRFQLTDALFTSCEKSYTRTMGIIGEGLEECQTWLAQQKQAREDYYFDLAMNPEKYATQPTEAAPLPETTETLPAA